MRKLPILALAVCLVGLCGCKSKTVEPQPALAANSSGSSGSVGGGSSDDIRPMTPGAGPITPVSGGENLGGTTGGGPAQVAKERAKSAAAAGSANTTQGTGGDD